MAVSLPCDPQEAILLENDIVGVRLWGPPRQPTLSIGRSDIWDRRWFGDRESVMTSVLIRELASQDRLGEADAYNVYMQYDFPCPKPGAQLILGTPFATKASVRRLPDGSVELLAEGDGKWLTATISVSLEHSWVVIYCRSEGLQAEDVHIRLYRHCDTVVPGGQVDPTLGGGLSPADFKPLPPPRAFQAQGDFGVAQDFFAESTFPGGFTAAVAATVIDAEPMVTVNENEQGLGTSLWAEKEGRVEFGVVKRYTPINASPGTAVTARFAVLPAAFTVVAAIATTQDGPDAVAKAVHFLDEARTMGSGGLRAEQQAAASRHARPYPARLAISGSVGINGLYGMANPSPQREGDRTVLAAPPLEWPNLRRRDGYYSDIPPCTVANTKFWFQDAGIWHNDFHLNEIRAEMMLTMGLFRELRPYCEMIANLLPMAQENARDVYQLPGAMFPLAHFPLRCKRGVVHTSLTWEQDMGLNGLVCKPLWLYYRYTGDKEFLHDLAYPVLRAAAHFSAAYLTEASDGRLHIAPTVSPEHWGLTAKFERNHDCTSALTLTKYLLCAAAEAADLLKVDAEPAAAWRVAAARLTPYPLGDTAEGPVWVDVAGAPPIEYNIPVPLAPVFWGDDVGLDSPSEVLALALRTARQIRIWQPHSLYLDQYILPRLGIWRDGTNIGPEHCLLSYQSLHLFPCVPPTGEIIMEHLAAQGGFRVSAVRTAKGTIEGVAILSTLGGDCRVTSPWPGRDVVVRDDKDRKVLVERSGNETICFATESNTVYRLLP